MNRNAFCGLALLALAAGLMATGCGSGDGSSSAESTAKTSSGSPGYPPGAFVATGNPGKFYQVLVNSEVLTLYIFEKDGKGSGKSTCYGVCERAWPPLLSTTPRRPVASGPGTHNAMVGTIPRRNGTKQVTYAGWPLYQFAGDELGDAKGAGAEAFGGRWHPLFPSGKVAVH